MYLKNAINLNIFSSCERFHTQLVWVFFCHFFYFSWVFFSHLWIFTYGLFMLFAEFFLSCSEFFSHFLPLLLEFYEHFPWRTPSSIELLYISLSSIGSNKFRWVLLRSLEFPGIKKYLYSLVSFSFPSLGEKLVPKS